MKILYILILCFGSSLTIYERLGTELLQTDRYICLSLHNPVVGEAENVLEKLRHFITYLRRLRELRIDKQKKRAIRISDALFDQGRPKFLQMDYERIIPELKSEFGWTDEQINIFDDLKAETERVCGELYRKYKYNIYLKYSTRKPLPF